MKVNLSVAISKDLLKAIYIRYKTHSPFTEATQQAAAIKLRCDERNEPDFEVNTRHTDELDDEASWRSRISSKLVKRGGHH